MSLLDKVNIIISSNEEVYWYNEFQIQLYMSKKYLEAFKEAALIECGEFDENFPPPTHIVADLAENFIKDHDLFLSDFFEAIQILSKGLKLNVRKL